VIANLKPYAEYKDSGLPWLGKVPAHWQIARSKRLFTPRKELARPDDVQLSATQAYGVIAQSLYEERTGYRVVKISMHLDKRRHVEKDDFIISMRSFQGGLERAWSTGAIRSSYVVLKPEVQFDAAYYRYLFKSVPYIAALRATGDFIRDGQDLNYSNFCGVDLPLISSREQAAIGRFLDWANARLDRAIKAKRKVIALLTEQKQAIVLSAISGQFDANIALVPTGDRWFPKLPVNWRPLTLRRVINSAIDGPHFSPTYLDTGIPFLSARNVKVDRWELANAKYISEKDYADFSRRVQPTIGDVLYTKGGTTGVARVVDLSFPFQVWVHIAVLKVKHTLVDPGYLAVCLNSSRCYEQAQLHTRGATNQDLGLGRMKDIVLPVPRELETQRSVLARLRQEVAPLDADISAAQREIELLREYRTRLIADVVTGKLDVRDAAARLPDEAPVDMVDDPDNDSDINNDDDSELSEEEAEA
jgi:type I restriction enzyme S subunit